MTGLTLLNFYVPAFNFLLFLLLFFLAFRSVFSGLARKQREDFLQAKTDAERQRKAAEKTLRELLYQEQELAKKHHAITEQAREDSRIRAEQILDDARLHAAQIREESQRLLKADYQLAKKRLHNELEQAIEGLLNDQLGSMNSKTKDRFAQRQIEELHQTTSAYTRSLPF